jgi:hypothetical protein
MSLQQDQKTLHQVLLNANMNPTRPTHQTRLALPPFRIPTLTTARLAAPLGARIVLPLAQDSTVGSPAIREYGLVSVILRNIFPQKGKHAVASISEDEPKNLTHQARDSDPHPERGRELDTDFIDLDSVSFGSGDGGDAFSSYFLLYASCVFFRRLRIVRRETFWLLAIPLWEVLSRREAKMRSSFSGVMARLMGLRVKVLRQAWQRQRAVPLSFLPNLMQSRLAQ